MKYATHHMMKALMITCLFVLGVTTSTLADGAMPPKIVLPENAKWMAMIPEMGEEGPAMSVVFGEPGVIGKPFGGMFRVPANGESPLHTHTSDYWAVMVAGTESAREKAEGEPMKISPGSTWFQPAKAAHVNKCMGPEDCVFFVYYPNGMDYIPAAR